MLDLGLTGYKIKERPCGDLTRMELETFQRQGQYTRVLLHDEASALLTAFVAATLSSSESKAELGEDAGDAAALCVGLAALGAFLQTNVTGPVLDLAGQVEERFAHLQKSLGASSSLRRTCLTSLDIDGVSVYPYIPKIELFCLARWVLLTRLSGMGPAPPLAGRSDESDVDPAEASLAWLKLRIHVWHYKLLTEPNPGPGSVFNKMTQWSELPSLQEQIQACLDETERQLDGSAGSWTAQDKVHFLLEKTNIYAMLGLDLKAQAALDAASKLHGFEFVLTGALGKRTRFQDKSTSQLVILAKSDTRSDAETQSMSGSNEAEAPPERSAAAEGAVPEALPLNNDTLLEAVDFSDAGKASTEVLAPLQGLSPDNQPQLSPLDQIILLSAATLKDAFSPLDSLTLEEILPYASRVLADKANNWQIYSQALIVRSRIELHRSRTVERGVLQMQAMVDQVVVDISAPEPKAAPVGVADSDVREDETSIPSIEITAPNNQSREADKPTSFFPAPKPTEQAPPQVRLRYIHALSTPPRWHLEAELAFAWAGVGSLVSALEIFKRLRLWAEVALCLASSASMDDEGGRGAGGEDKARGLIRWQLFQPTNPSETRSNAEDETEVDVLSLKAVDFEGPERVPPPPNAPRLFCILGDIETQPQFYERAWELSKHRYSRAQRSLGEHYLQQRNWEAALDAYKKAVSANRLNGQLWSRLGDIDLRLGLFADAAEAFGRAIGAANDATGGEDARTWSNLGSALYSLYTETMEIQKLDEKRNQEGDVGDGSTQPKTDADVATETVQDEGGDEAGDNTVLVATATAKRDPAVLLAQSLAAFKRGATISHDNWRIWDNVVTLASRMRPPAVSDITLALRNILAVRKTEDAIDVDVVRLLLNEAVLSKPKPASGVPARGSREKVVCDLIETVFVPVITKRSELWELVARERIWRGDLAGGIDAAEKGWRAAVGGASTGALGPTLAASRGSGGGSGGDEENRNWLENADAWDNVVARTDELVSILENYGPEAATVGTRWKMKARSALRSVMGKGKERWEGSAGWTTLETLLEGLK